MKIRSTIDALAARRMPDALEASRYARDLATEWRALLEAPEELEGEDLDGDASEHDSLLFRPRPGLDPALDPVDAELPLARRPGDVLGEFELVRLIGKGAMGHVWEAWQANLDRTVALKLIRPDRISAGTRVLFGREGRAAARLRHPAIVTVFAMGEADGTPWIAQEFVDGECTLADFLAEIDRRQLPRDYDRRIALFFFQLAEALAYAHGANVMHRDLKPANVLVGAGDRPKLTDFGLAELEEDDPTTHPTIAGTPSYMSPEQALGKTDELGRRSDVFSLGSMLYEALTLERPFRGESVRDVLAAVVERRPVPCRELRASIAPDMAAIVERALEKRPDDRYASMEAFAADLAAFLDGRAVAARPIGIVPRGWRWARRHRLGATLGLAVLVLLVVGAIGVQRAAHATMLERVDKALLEADAAIERDDQGAAKRALDRAESLVPGRPDLPLRRAAALLRLGQVRGASHAAMDAKVRGYDFEAPLGDDAIDHHLRSIYLFAMVGPSAEAETRAGLERALELAPERRSPWFLLYKLNRTATRRDDALAALEQFKRGVRRGHVNGDLLDARILELQGRFEEALVILDRMAREHALDPSPLEDTDFYELYGTCLLEVGRVHEAVEILQRGIELAPLAYANWVHLSIAWLLVGNRDDRSMEERCAALDRAAAMASTPTVRHWNLRCSLGVLAQVEDLRNKFFDRDETKAMDALIAAFPDDPVATRLQADVFYDQGIEDWQAGRWAEARLRLEQGAALHKHRLAPLVVLAQCLTYVPTPPQADLERALELLDDAMQLWQTGHAPGSPPSHFGANAPIHERTKVEQGLLTTRLYVAGCLGRFDLFPPTRELLDRQVAEAGGFVEFTEQLTYAEALLLHEDPLERDIVKAQELLDDYLTRTGVALGEWPADWDPTMQNILSRIEAGRLAREE